MRSTGRNPSRSLMPIMCPFTSAFQVCIRCGTHLARLQEPQRGDLHREPEPVPAVRTADERAPLEARCSGSCTLVARLEYATTLALVRPARRWCTSCAPAWPACSSERRSASTSALSGSRSQVSGGRLDHQRGDRGRRDDSTMLVGRPGPTHEPDRVRRVVRRGLRGQLVEEPDVDGQVEHPVHVAEPEPVAAPLQELRGRATPRAVPRLGVRPVGLGVQHRAAVPAGDLLHVGEHGRPVPASPVLRVGVDLRACACVEVVDEGAGRTWPATTVAPSSTPANWLAEPVALGRPASATSVSASVHGVAARPRGRARPRRCTDGVPRGHRCLVERVDPHDLHQSRFCTSRQRSTTR